MKQTTNEITSAAYFKLLNGIFVEPNPELIPIVNFLRSLVDVGDRKRVTDDRLEVEFSTKYTEYNVVALQRI